MNWWRDYVMPSVRISPLCNTNRSAASQSAKCHKVSAQTSKPCIVEGSKKRVRFWFTQFTVQHSTKLRIVLLRIMLSMLPIRCIGSLIPLSGLKITSDTPLSNWETNSPTHSFINTFFKWWLSIKSINSRMLMQRWLLRVWIWKPLRCLPLRW